MNHQQINLAVDFLKQCQKIAQKIKLTKASVYQLLKEFNITDYDISTNQDMYPLEYSSDWCDFFSKRNDILPYARGNYWTGFDYGNINSEHKFIKIYLSLDRNHLFEGVKQLFDFIARENIMHTSKSTSIVRTDNVIIRLNTGDLAGLKKITQYIESNKYIQEGMNNVNPFLPSVGKIGVMYDDGRSYNSELADLIAAYINNHLYDTEISFSDFTKFINRKKQYDTIFLSTFNQAFFEKGPYQRVVDNTPNQANSTFESSVPINDKEYMLKLAVNVSFEKYGKIQAIAAIKNALAGNYSYFSRVTYDELGNEILLRSYLENNLSPEELKQYILKNNNLSEVDSLEDVIRNYVDFTIYEYKGSILEDALFATAKKYSDSEDYVANRISRYANSGEETIFCRYNTYVKNNYNFRENVLRNVPPSKVYEVVESILYNSGIDYSSKLNSEKADCCAKLIMERVYSMQY